jgi:molybdopterin synthase sulfur carrier subunit
MGTFYRSNWRRRWGDVNAKSQLHTVRRGAGALLAAEPTTEYNFRMHDVAPMIRVKVLFFGRVRELLSKAEDHAEIAEGATLENLFESYARKYPQLANFRASLVASRNQEFAAWGTQLGAGDEIAFLPPVSGG